MKARAEGLSGAANATATGTAGATTIWWLCFPIAMIDGYDTLLMSFLAPVIGKEMGAAPEAFRGIFTATYAGAACGAVLLGAAADRCGRKPILLVSLALAGLFTALAAGMHTLDGLMWCRALAGLGLGGAIPVISALAATGVPPEHTRAAVTRVFIGYPVGAILGGLLTAWLLSALGWRGLLLGTGVLALGLLAPTQWILKASEANAIDPSANDRGANEPNANDRSSSAKALNANIPAPLVSVSAIPNPLATLFTPAYARVTLILGIAVSLILGVSYFLVSWIPTVLTLKGWSVREAAATAVLLNVGGLLGAGSLSAARVGRAAPARAIGASLCIGALLIGSFGVALHASATAVIATAIFCMGVLIIGAQITIPALAAWLYPPHSSASGVGFAMACGRIGSIVGPFIGGYLLAAHMSWESLFVVAAAPALLAGLALLTLSGADRSRR